MGRELRGKIERKTRGRVDSAEVKGGRGGKVENREIGEGE